MSVIENTFKKESNASNSDPLLPSIHFLENITSIKSNMYEGFDTFPIPTKKNLRQWKKWFNKNKNRLYFDEKELKVKVKLLKTS